MGASATAKGYGPDVYLGGESEPIWGKKYKVRFISKSTGRKIDLNITYDTEHVLTPEEMELRNMNTEPSNNWWDLFTSWFGSSP